MVECDAATGVNTAEVFGLAVAKAFVTKYEQLYKERQRKKFQVCFPLLWRTFSSFHSFVSSNSSIIRAFFLFQAKISIEGVRRVFEALEQRSREQDGRELTEEERMNLADEAEYVLIIFRWQRFRYSSFMCSHYCFIFFLLDACFMRRKRDSVARRKSEQRPWKNKDN